MRFLYPFVLLCLLAASVFAQDSPATQSDGPNITVVEKKWRTEYHNPALDKDPIKVMKEREQDDRRRKDIDRTNQILIDRGMPGNQSTVPLPSRDGKKSDGITVTYIYELKVTNTGQKTIQSLNWEYVFSELGTERELGRRRFETKISISPGKTKNLMMRSPFPPTGAVSAREEKYSEKVVVQSVSYSDGTAWQSSSN